MLTRTRTTLIAATATIALSGAALAGEANGPTVMDDAALSRLVAGSSLGIEVRLESEPSLLVNHAIGVDDQIFRTISAAGDGTQNDITPVDFSSQDGYGSMHVLTEGVSVFLKHPK